MSAIVQIWSIAITLLDNTSRSVIQIFKTERNRTLPVIMRSYACTARSSGNISIIGRTPFAAANHRASSESLEVPAGQPMIDLRVSNNCNEVTAKGSKQSYRDGFEDYETHHAPS